MEPHYSFHKTLLNLPNTFSFSEPIRIIAFYVDPLDMYMHFFSFDFRLQPCQKPRLSLGDIIVFMRFCFVNVLVPRFV